MNHRDPCPVCREVVPAYCSRCEFCLDCCGCSLEGELRPETPDELDQAVELADDEDGIIQGPWRNS